MRPDSSEYAPFYAGYIELVPEDDVLSAIETQSSETQKVLSSIDEARGSYRYAEGKWSVKEMFGHITDGERVFGYRALCISRGEEQPLPGFDEKEYTANANYDSWKIGDLAEQYALVRRANIVMFRNLPADAWARRGIASNNPVTVRALAYMMVGHERHHLRVLRERYKI
jgi:DinB superfamily